MSTSEPEMKETDSVTVDEKTAEEPKYLTGVSLALVMLCVLFANILTSLDATIVAAAIPTIANDLKTLTDVGWFGSAYLLTGTAFQPVWGKCLSSFPIKWVFLTSLAIFELGSLVCAVAKTSAVFILGRAVAGAGSGGIYIGLMAICAACLPLKWQPLATSIVTGSYGIGASAGPVVGGAITTRASWPWCFYINLMPLPLVIPVIVFCLNPPKRDDSAHGSLKQRVLRIDLGGTGLLLAAVTMLLLTLQDAGIARPWKSGYSIGLLIGFVLTSIAYVFYQRWLGDNASLNLKLFKNKNVTLAAVLYAVVGCMWFPVLTELPIYFQAVRGTSALRSGVLMLGLIVPNVTASVLAGALVTSIGQFHPPMWFGAFICPIGCGLLTTLGVDTSVAKAVGYQVVIGFAMGALYMQPYMASQFLVKPEERPASATIVIFSSTLASTIFVAVAQSIYQNRFYVEVQKIQGIDAKGIIDEGLTAFRTMVSPEVLPQFILAASKACKAVFYLTTAAAIIGAFACVFIDRPTPPPAKPEMSEKAVASEA